MLAAYTVYCSQMVFYIEKQSFKTKNDSPRKITGIHHSIQKEKKKTVHRDPQSNLYKSCCKRENKWKGKNNGMKIREKIGCSNSRHAKWVAQIALLSMLSEMFLFFSSSKVWSSTRHLRKNEQWF